MSAQKNALEQLRAMTVISADTGDIEAIRKFKPTDATTNPTLILQALNMDQYSHILRECVEEAKKEAKSTDSSEFLDDVVDRVIVKFGIEILNIVPGKVSTELDARLSFDTAGTVEKAHRIAALYRQHGVDVQARVMMKIASTWEGVQAARQLEKEGIRCNMTLLFSFHQAVACAQAGVCLISPFVGRIMDWYKKAQGVQCYAPHEDPGVESVTSIFHYFKRFSHNTTVMGASFRNCDEILELAGCDKLTISPKLMEELQHKHVDVPRKLDAAKAKSLTLTEIPSIDEKTFRWQLNEDAMATEKLAEGIRNFAADICKLEELIKACLSGKANA